MNFVYISFEYVIRKMITQPLYFLGAKPHGQFIQLCRQLHPQSLLLRVEVSPNIFSKFLLMTNPPLVAYRQSIVFLLVPKNVQLHINTLERPDLFVQQLSNEFHTTIQFRMESVEQESMACFFKLYFRLCLCSMQLCQLCVTVLIVLHQNNWVFCYTGKHLQMVHQSGH